MTIQFTEWPKTSRFFRDIVITEKLDGTNAAIGITAVSDEGNHDPHGFAYVSHEGQMYQLHAQSRNRLIIPGKQDNYGFAGWVERNAAELVAHLGEGLHYGEWWGSGIQRGYGLQKGEKRFSLFNTRRFKDIWDQSAGLLHCVPVIYEGPLAEKQITQALANLEENGSWASFGFKNPEGICIYHSASRIVQKVTLDNNDAGKWEHL